MRPGWKTLLGAALVAPALLISTFGQTPSYGDEPGLFGRLFRFGGGAGASASKPAPTPPPAQPTPDASAPGLIFSNPAAAPPASTASPRILPQPRVSRAVTEADPILTRVALVRSSDGAQFGMFLQVYADGTVLDNEGTHHVSHADMKPLIDVLQSGDLYRVRGHCGAPATDFVEQVHLVVYERSLGRLKANAFSYSGNPQGCDHAIRHVHAALEAIQTKIARPATPVATVPGGNAGPSFSQPPESIGPAGSSISLSPSQ